MQPQSSNQPDPSSIMQVGMGFWASKTLLAAIKFELFTILGDEKMKAQEIKQKIGLHDRSLYDFLDSLVGLGFLNREGIKETAVYSNTVNTAFFLHRKKPTYIGGILEMANDRLYKFWSDLEEGLKTGQPQNETKQSDRNPFEILYEDQEKLSQFMEAMAGIQMGAFMAFAKTFPFKQYKSLCDIGGATGALSIQVALNNPHIKCTSFDLPAVKPVTEKWIERFNIKDRVQVASGDFFKDEFPKADIITMGNILHDWGYDDKLRLIQSAYKALHPNGAFVVIESIIDNERKQNVFGLLMSLNMLIETQEGYDFTFNDFQELAKKAGFSKFEFMQLAGPTGAAIAYK